MILITNALIPVSLLIILGYFFKKIRFPSVDFWSMMDKFTYFILMPALLTYKLFTANLSELNNLNFLIAGLGTIFLVALLTLLLNKIFKFENSAFTSIFQGATRFNTYVFLALVGAVFDDTGLVIAAFFITFAIPILNLLCIGVFSIFVHKREFSIKSLFKMIFTNPLIVACLLGGMINYLEINLTSPLENTLKILSAAALPMGLLSVGVGLELRQMNIIKKELFVPIVLKLLIYPVLMYFLAKGFDVEGVAFYVLIIFAALPTAPSSYILAKQLGGDVKLISSIITVEILLSMLSIAFVFSLLNI